MACGDFKPSQIESISQQHLNQAIQMMFGLSPVTSVGVDQLPEVRAVVVMLDR